MYLSKKHHISMVLVQNILFFAFILSLSSTQTDRFIGCVLKTSVWISDSISEVYWVTIEDFWCLGRELTRFETTMKFGYSSICCRFYKNMVFLLLFCISMMHRHIAYVGSTLGFETARTFKSLFVTDFRFSEFEWGFNVIEPLQKHDISMVLVQNMAKQWYWLIYWLCFKTLDSIHIWGTLDLMMHRRDV